MRWEVVLIYYVHRTADVSRCNIPDDAVRTYASLCLCASLYFLNTKTSLLYFVLYGINIYYVLYGILYYAILAPDAHDSVSRRFGDMEGSIEQ